MAVSAHDVARELRARLGEIGNARLHKLLYYCQGWCLALTGRPMFTEPIQAWDDGPVVAWLWRDEDRHVEPPPPTPLDDEMVAVLDHVLSRHGTISGGNLVKQTHEESPWIVAYDRARNSELNHGILAEFFRTVKESEALLADPNVARELQIAVVAARVTPARPDHRREIEARLSALS